MPVFVELHPAPLEWSFLAEPDFPCQHGGLHINHRPAVGAVGRLKQHVDHLRGDLGYIRAPSKRSERSGRYTYIQTYSYTQHTLFDI